MRPHGDLQHCAQACTTILRPITLCHCLCQTHQHVCPQVYMYTKYTTDLGRRLFRWSQDKVDRRWAARHEWGGKQVYGMISSVQG